MRPPTISIGMPVYNEERHLDRALQSLFAQTCTDFEIVLSDNGSTDRTWEICSRHAKADQRVRAFRSPRNHGAVWNANHVLELAEGEYFLSAGGHDLWHPSYLERCLEVLRSDPQVVLAQSLTVMIDGDDRAVGIMPGWLDTRGVGQMFRFNMVQWGLVNGNLICGLIRREALNKTGRCRNNIGPHLILLSELSLLGQFALVPEPLFCRREVRQQEDMVTKLRRWHQTMDPATSGKSLSSSLIHFAEEHFRIALRARVTFWPRLLLFPSIFLILLAKAAKFVQWRGRPVQDAVLPGSLRSVKTWAGGPILPP